MSDGLPSTYVIQTAWEANKEPFNGFEGICVDLGAQKTVIGTYQRNEYSALLNTKLEVILHCIKAKFLFGSHKQEIEGYITIRIPI